MLAEAEAELTAAENAVVHLRQVVDGLRGLLDNYARPDLALGEGEAAADITPPSSYPKPLDAVTRALEAHPNQAVDFKELWSFIQDRGWVDPEYKAYRNAADAAVRRLARGRGPVRRREDGRYLYSVGVKDHVVDGHDDSTEPLTLNGSGPLASTEATI